MNVDELLTKARDAVHVTRVFGEPYEKNGLTVIPAANVMGGGGGGTGHADAELPTGAGASEGQLDFDGGAVDSSASA